MSHDLKIAVNASTQVYGIFGYPVGHSLSPALHNAAFAHFKINAVYLAFPIEPAFLGIAFEGLRALGFGGVNVTIPYKEEALGYVDEIPEDIDRCTGAINTIHHSEGRLVGYNTDGPGFLKALHSELSFNPEGRSVLVLGAGGAARGVVFSLARAHAAKIWVLNRSLDRAQGLAEHAAGFFPETEFEAVKHLYEVQGEKIDLVVNATSCGMDNQEVPLDLRVLERKTSVYDLVYRNGETPFLKSARDLGFPCADGLGMLVNQAALAFEIWTGHGGAEDVMRAALKGGKI